MLLAILRETVASVVVKLSESTISCSAITRVNFGLNADLSEAWKYRMQPVSATMLRSGERMWNMYFTMYDGRVCCVRDAARVSSVRLFARLFVCLSVGLSVCRQYAYIKTRFSHRTKQFRAMVSIHDLQEVLHGIFKKTLLNPSDSNQPSWKLWNHFILTKNHPMWMRSGTQQKILNSMTVTWPNMNISRVQNGERPSY